MRNQPTAWLCVFCLASVASVLAPDIARAQAAAEYRTHTEAAKSWPRYAVRGAKAMVAPDEEVGSTAGVEILKPLRNSHDPTVTRALTSAATLTPPRLTYRS